MISHPNFCRVQLSSHSCICDFNNRLANFVAIEREKNRITTIAAFVNEQTKLSTKERVGSFRVLRGPVTSLYSAAQEELADKSVRTNQKRKDQGKGKKAKGRKPEQLREGRDQMEDEKASGLAPYDNQKLADQTGISTRQAAGKGGYSQQQQELLERQVNDQTSWEGELSPASKRYLAGHGQADSVTRSILRKPLAKKSGRDGMVPVGGTASQRANARYGPGAGNWTSWER